MPSLMTDDDRNAKREALKSNWKIASAAQFVSLFRIAFKLPEIEIEDLEEGLLDKANVERKILIELFVALLRGINYKVNKENWELYLRKLVQKKFVPEEGRNNPFPEPNFELFKKTEGLVSLDTTDSFLEDLSLQENSLDRYSGLQDQEYLTSFWDLDSSSQADIILFLCYMRLDRSDAAEAMKNMDSDILRAQTLGCDNDGNKYWYFYGTRLYKEQPSPEKKLNWDDELKQQKVQPRRGRGRPRKILCKPRKSDGESDDLEEDGNQKKFMNTDEKSVWSVVCNTLDDWINFADKFKDSNTKCERSLFEVIQANFLPALNEIYQEKEKRLRQKIKELISLPMITKRETRSHNRTISHDKKSNGYNNVKENLKRDRANRLEERNRRASDVSTRTARRSFKYYDEDNDEEIPDEDNDEEMSEDFSDDTTHSLKDNYVQDYQPLYSNGIDLKPGILRLVGQIKLCKDAWPFLNPVQKEEAPGYYEIISQPMDLSTITRKLLNHCYNSVNDLDADFRKLVSNSRLYNGEHGVHTKMAHSVYNMFLCGLNKLFEEYGINNISFTNIKEENKFKSNSKHSKVASKRRKMKPDEGKKRKKKTSHLSALESLSKEAELSIKKSNKVLKSLYTNSDIRHSSLKVVSIHSNPREVLERFLSDSSNQEHEEDSSNNSSLLGEENTNSMEDFDVCNNSVSGSHGYLESHNNDDNSNESVFTNQENEKGNVNYDGQKDAVLKEVPDQQLSENDSNLPDSSREDDRKASNSSTEGLLHGMDNILDECSNQSITNGNISFSREAIYSSGEVNTSPGGRSVHSAQSRSSDSSTPENTRKSSPESSLFIQSSIVDKHVPFLQDSLGIQSNFTFPSNNNEPSTVDASILGFSSFTSAPSRISPELSNQSEIKQLTPPPAQVATFTTHMSPTTSPKGLPIPQVNSAYDKSFSYQNPVQILKPEPNKFPTMKVSLPPSTGEILVVPDKTDPHKMTFHLLAQPHANPSQPIQSSMELRANMDGVRNEVAQSAGNKMYKDTSSAIAPKRTSPVIEIPQFQSASSYGMPLLSQPPVSSSFSNLLKPVSPYPNFTSNSSFPSMPGPSVSSFPPVSTPSMPNFPSMPSFQSMSNNFIPVNTNAISTSPNSFLPGNASSAAIASKTDQQLFKIKSSNFIASGTNHDAATRSSNIVNYSAENISLIPQSSNSTRTISSSVTSSVLSSNKISRSSKSKSETTSKKATTVAQKLYASNSSYVHPSNVISNGNGHYEILVPTVDQFTRFQTSDRQSNNQNMLKSFPEGSALYTSTYPNSLQNYGLTTTPHLVYAQVNPNQSSQIINIPNYMLASQNMFQHPMNPSIMNVQPFQVPNRPVVPMDLNGR